MNNVQELYDKFVPTIPGAVIVYNLLESPCKLLGTYFTFSEAYGAMKSHASVWHGLQPNKDQVKLISFEEYNPDGEVKLVCDKYGYIYPTVPPLSMDAVYKDIYNTYHINRYKIIPMSLTAKVGSSFVTYQEYDEAFEKINLSVKKKDLVNDF